MMAPFPFAFPSLLPISLFGTTTNERLAVDPAAISAYAGLLALISGSEKRKPEKFLAASKKSKLYNYYGSRSKFT